MSVHDFRYCSCKSVAVDGGCEYLRRCFVDTQEDYEELSEYWDEQDGSYAPASPCSANL